MPLCEIYTAIEFMFGRSKDRIFHVQPAIVGIHLPVLIDAVVDIGFNTPVLNFSGIDIFPGAGSVEGTCTFRG